VQSDALGEQTPLTFPHRTDITAHHRQPGPAPGARATAVTRPGSAWNR
jgi:hypothetical protein